MNEQPPNTPPAPGAEEAPAFAPRIDLGGLQQSASAIEAAIGKVIIGQRHLVELLLTAILADGHVLIEGVPGVAKTLAAKLMARTLSVKFSRIQFTPDLMPSDVIGTSVFNQKSHEFEFRPGPVFANVVLIDEINRAPAKTQAALFECMQEHQVTVDGRTYPLEPPFIVLATQNPIEQEGTYRLPEAQLDRFLYKIEVGYPNAEEEAQILSGFHARKNKQGLEEVQPVISAKEIVEYRARTAEVHAEAKLLDYIAAIVQQTRNNTALFLGASPRASLAILAGAKARAALSGRDFITPDDVKHIAPHVLRHRIILTPEKEMEGGTANEVVKQLIERIEVPR